MGASFAKNEVTPAKRRADLIVYTDGGALADPGQNWSGLVFVCGVNSPDYDIAAGTMTNKRYPLASPSDDTVEAVDYTTNDTLQLTAHGLLTGDGPVQLLTTTTLPAPLATATPYWIIRFDADNIRLATSLANAYAGTFVDLTDAGAGTHTVDLTGVGTERAAPGFFTYEATQAELNFDGSEFSIMVEGSGFARANGGGTYTSVAMTAQSSAFDAIAEGSHTYGDLIRLAASVLAGKVINFTTSTQSFRDLADSKTRITGTTDSTGRLSITIVDLT